MNWPYAVAVGVMMLGLYVMVAHRNLLKKLVGMTIFQTAIILFFLLTAVKRHATLPIVREGLPPEAAMNPLPHALMLTAIVVMVATTGVALAILVRLYERYQSIEEDDIAARVEAEAPAGGA
ncbi:MAG TPA: cation:proton antiporter subunit C [Methylomirabilota bacterium]